MTAMPIALTGLAVDVNDLAQVVGKVKLKGVALVLVSLYVFPASHGFANGRLNAICLLPGSRIASAGLRSRTHRVLRRLGGQVTSRAGLVGTLLGMPLLVRQVEAASTTAAPTNMPVDPVLLTVGTIVVGYFVWRAVKAWKTDRQWAKKRSNSEKNDSAHSM